MTDIKRIEGIGETYGSQLKSSGVASVEALLEKGRTPAGREQVAESIGVSPERVLEWVNRADLFRVPGIGEEYSDLLEAAGVDTVPELARRNPENLHQQLNETNKQKKIVRRLPSLEQVRGWIADAKGLPRAIEY